MRKINLKPVGEITLDIYDRALWQVANECAKSWNAPLSQFVHFAVRMYVKRYRDHDRLTDWRKARDARDPDLAVLRDFIEKEEARAKAKTEAEGDDPVVRAARSRGSGRQ